MFGPGSPTSRRWSGFSGPPSRGVRGARGPTARSSRRCRGRAAPAHRRPPRVDASPGRACAERRRCLAASGQYPARAHHAGLQGNSQGVHAAGQRARRAGFTPASAHTSQLSLSGKTGAWRGRTTGAALRPGRRISTGRRLIAGKRGERRRVTRAAAMMGTEKPWLRPSPWDAVTGSGDGSERRRDGSEVETLGLWRALLMGLGVGFLGFWGPLGVLIWRWVR
jgi:hypothetical protein